MMLKEMPIPPVIAQTDNLAVRQGLTNLSPKMLVSLIAAIVLMGFGIGVSFWSFKQIEDAANSRKHIFISISQAHDVLINILDAETGKRGYLLTGDESFLAPYLVVRNNVLANLHTLRQHSSNTAAHIHLDRLVPLITQKLAEMAEVIDLQHKHNLAAALSLLSIDEGKQLMDAIRNEMHSFIEMETSALEKQEASFQQKMRNQFAIIVTTSLFTLLFAIWFAIFIYRAAQQGFKDRVHLETQSLLKLQEETNQQLLETNLNLQISEERLYVTLRSIGDAVIATDAEARVTLLNPLAEKLTGWTQAQALGLPVSDIFHIINQETRVEATIPVMEALAHGAIQGLANHTILIARDGSECAIADSCAPICNRDGREVGAVLVFRDVTAEHAVQQHLRDTSALVKTIFNTVADGIITLHACGGLIETVNPATEQMFGYSAEELIGQPISFLIPELESELCNLCLDYHHSTDDAHGRELLGRCKNASVFPLDMALSEMWLGGERYFTGILRNNTLRKQVEAERVQHYEVLHLKHAELAISQAAAEKANRAKSDFLSNMSHELRTPLNAILGFAQLLESGNPLPTPAQLMRVQQIIKAGWYLLDLINEILDLALIESGKLSLSLEAVLLSDVMRECAALIETLAQQHTISITFLPCDPGYCVKADHTRLKQVLINLLSNAIKYNCEQGRVEITCSVESHERIRISISDTGIGLSVEQLAHLFQPFNRLGQEQGSEEGTGIGLVVTKRLIELMQGRLGVESQVGEGSVFWLELQRVVDQEVLAEQSQTTVGGAPQHEIHPGLRTLLYVEDNLANLLLVEQIIADHPAITMLTARDAYQGITLARAQRPVVILMDINLPGINGFEALKLLQADAGISHIPVIAISANAMPQDIEKGLEVGFFRYLTKPIKVNEFMLALDDALNFAANTLPTTQATGTQK